MELSFGIRTWLSLLLIVMGFMSTVVSVLYSPWLVLVAIAMFTLAVVMLADDIRIHGRERGDFKKKTIHELWIMAGMLIGIPIGEPRPIPYNEWSSKGASFQRAALSDDYELSKSFYDSIDARNDFFAAHPAHEPFRIEDSMKFKLSCLENFLRLVDTTMIQQSDLKERFDDIVAKAKEQRDTMSASMNP
jgi:hypothetical protein